MAISTFIITVVEVILFFLIIGLCLSQPKDKSRKRFLTLTLIFIFYNVASGFLPDKRILINLLIQNILAFGSGIILASYYFYYLVKELKIKQQELFNSKYLFLSLFVSFLLFYIGAYLFTGNFALAKKYFIIFPVVIALYFCFLTLKFLRSNYSNKLTNKSPYVTMATAGYIGIIFMASMPIVVYFGDFQILNNSLVNVSYFLTLYAFLQLISFQVKQKNLQVLATSFVDEKNNSGIQNFFVQRYNLTKRELDVVALILAKKKFTIIAEELNISEKTVSKYASDIYKKTKCANKACLINKFQQKNQEFEKIIK